MTRPATARRAETHAGGATRRPLRAVPPPRRVSGPSRRPAPAAAAPGILLGAAGLARTLPDCRAVDRLIRGRTWVAVIAVALIGIVAMQVHMLGLNAGIGRAVEKTTTLEQQNTALRMEVSRLGSSDRIAAEAQRLGLVMPNAGEVRYVRSHDTDSARAARVMRSADPELAAKARANVEAGLGTGASALAPEAAEKAPGEAPAAPAGMDPAAVAPEEQVAATQQLPVDQAAAQAQAPAPVEPQPQPQQPVQQQPVEQQPVQPQSQAQPEPTAPAAAVTDAGGAAPAVGG
jgi:cell division protein FtsL